MITLTIQKCEREIEKYCYDIINGCASEIIATLADLSNDQSKIDYANHLCDEGTLGLAFMDLEFLVKSEKELNAN